MIRYCLLLPLLFSCSKKDSPEPSPTKPNVATPVEATSTETKTVIMPASAKDDRENAQQQIRTELAKVEEDPKRWGARLLLARAYIRQAVLTGSLQPYAEAIRYLEVALTFAKHDTTAVPLTLAEAHLALHQNVKAQEMLDVVPEKDRTSDNYLRIHGQLLLAKGDLEGAKAAFETLAARPTGSVRGHALLGHLADMQNDHKEALHLYSIAIRTAVDKQAGLKPWVLVLRGLSYLHRGRFPEAHEDFAKAVALSPNSILALEHLAEVQGRLGKTEEAAATYQKVLLLTRNPEFLDAFAGIQVERGNQAEADALIAEAKKAYDKMLKDFPKAAYGHAIDFYIGSGGDPALAVTMAEKDSSLRPNGSTFLALAQAQLANKNYEKAKTALDKAFTYKARSADLHWTASEIHRAMGNAEQADAEQALALAINPLQASM